MVDLCEVYAAELVAVIVDLSEEGIVVGALIDDLHPVSPRQRAHGPVRAHAMATRLPECD